MKKILVVEDEAVIALRLQQMLTIMGYDVIGISYSGDDALKKARRLLPDLILMDIMIPGKLNGIAAAEILGAELDVPVIFLTAFSEEKIIERAKKAEPYGYILKPFQDREIKAVIEVALHKKEMEKALRESKKKFKEFLDNLGDAAYEADAFGNITYTNKAAEILTGLPLKKLIGKPFLPLFTEKSQKIAMDLYQRALNGERLEFELTFTNGKIARFKNEPLIDKDGRIIGVFGIARDITDRVKAEEALQKAHNDLDRRVKERTVELNNALKTVKRSETELSQRKLALEKLNRELLETNQALSVLARNIDKKKEDLEKKIFTMCNSKLMPILKGLQKDVYCQKREADLELIINYLNEITHDSPLHHDIDSHLTDQEMRVAVMIKNGLTSQQIGDLLCISLHTVKTHRKNIRKKLKIDSTNINLVSYLKSKLKAQD
ncbi:MAG: response regulator [Desulfobacteraceae bacterium]|nr:response regulator [Desulfobacteraceae bacterium]